MACKIYADDERYMSCYMEHESEYWWRQLKLYKSSYSATSSILPVKKVVDDIVAIHFMLLYALSIIVRYYPSLWDRIEYGEFDDVGSIIEYYLSTFDKIILEEMIKRIEGKDVGIATPGSLNSTL